MKQLIKKPILTIILCISIGVSGITAGIVTVLARDSFVMNAETPNYSEAVETAISYYDSTNKNDTVYLEFYVSESNSEVVRRNREGDDVIGGSTGSLPTVAIANYSVAILPQTNNTLEGHTLLEKRYDLNNVLQKGLTGIAISDTVANKTGLKIGDEVVLDEKANISGKVERIVAATTEYNNLEEDTFTKKHMLDIPFMLIDDNLKEQLQTAVENRSNDPSNKVDKNDAFIATNQDDSIMYFKYYYRNHQGAEKFLEKMREFLMFESDK